MIVALRSDLAYATRAWTAGSDRLANSCGMTIRPELYTSVQFLRIPDSVSSVLPIHAGTANACVGRARMRSMALEAAEQGAHATLVAVYVHRDAETNAQLTAP